MDMMQIHDYARRLFAAFGDKAGVEAAQRASQLEADGDVGAARDWRRIENAIREMRGAKVS